MDLLVAAATGCLKEPTTVQVLSKTTKAKASNYFRPDVWRIKLTSNTSTTKSDKEHDVLLALPSVSQWWPAPYPHNLVLWELDLRPHCHARDRLQLWRMSIRTSDMTVSGLTQDDVKQVI